MGRPEAALSTDGPLASFAADLRQLRTRAGRPSYRAMAERAHFAASSLSRAASGSAVPSWDVVHAYLRACGVDDTETWRRRLMEVRAASVPADERPAAVDAKALETIRTPREFNKALNDLRRSRGVTLASLERHVGLADSTASSTLNSDRLPDLSFIQGVMGMLVAGSSEAAPWIETWARLADVPAPRPVENDVDPTAVGQALRSTARISMISLVAQAMALMTCLIVVFVAVNKSQADLEPIMNLTLAVGVTAIAGYLARMTGLALRDHRTGTRPLWLAASTLGTWLLLGTVLMASVAGLKTELVATSEASSGAASWLLLTMYLAAGITLMASSYAAPPPLLAHGAVARRLRLRRGVDAPPANELDQSQADAVAKLITALSSHTEACIQVGPILLVKIDGTVTVRQLGPHEIAFITSNRRVLSSPKTLLDTLDNLDKIDSGRQRDQNGAAMRLVIRQLDDGEPDVDEGELHRALKATSPATRANVLLLADDVRRRSWRDPALRSRVNRAVPVLRALVEIDPANYRYWAALGYAHKDSEPPNNNEAMRALNHAIEQRGDADPVISGKEHYEFARAGVQLRLLDGKLPDTETRTRIVHDLTVAWRDAEIRRNLQAALNGGDMSGPVDHEAHLILPYMATLPH